MPPKSSLSDLIDHANRLARSGQVPKALGVLSKLWKRGHHPAGVAAAQILYEHDQPDRARATLQTIDPTRVTSDRTRHTLARLALHLKLWGLAERVCADAPSDAPAWSKLRLKLAHALGRPDALRAARHQLATTSASDASWLLLQADTMLGESDPVAVLDLLDPLPPAVRALPDVARRRIAALLAAHQPAEQAIEAWLSTHLSLDHQARGIAWWVEAGHPEHAAALADTLAAQAPDDPRFPAWQARFALWRTNFEAARTLAHRAAGAPTARRTAAIATLLLEGPEAALPLLQAVVAEHPTDPTALTWLASALRQLGQLEEARDTAIAARSQCQEYHIPCRIEMWLARHAREGDEPPAQREQTVELRAQLTPLGNQHLLPAEELEAALVAFGGNRSLHPTTTSNGQLHAYPLPGDPRELARALQHRIRSWPLARVLAGFEPLLERFVDHPLVRTHRGEVLLWSGRFEAAADDFRRALARDPQTRWAWIGLGATQIMQGELDAGLATFQKGIDTIGFAGPTLYAYRAEACRLQGKRTEAMENIRVGLSVSPKRLSLWMHAAELDAEDGDLAPARALLDLVTRRIPGLALDTGARPGDPIGSFRRMRTAFVGNRASTLITWFHEGQIRTAMWSPLPEEVRAAFSRW